ncbi:Potassium efflux system KefA protein / Small-conductance mechanosensitive channel [hydrothermal vent metagenome]|uniref:Potassium efflux system KefA protein / Small-conductance mechanosensitive channel n=2 Tax=hydrothermal vent metagenome TaxID=652676 RepID=A0A3B1DI60_9ZZZZ
MIEDIMQRTFFSNTISDYFVSLAILVIGVLVVMVLKRIIIKRLKVWADRTATTLDDFFVNIVESRLVPVFYFGVVYLSIHTLALGPSFTKAFDLVIAVLLTIFSVRFLVAIVNYTIENVWLKKEEDTTTKYSIKGLLPVINVIIWGIAITFLLDNLGFKISTVIAGLGIGGVAVALAAQTVLGDLFSYFAILFDRPFKIGDFIIVGDYLGTIEHVGIKTTRIRSLSGEQVVFSNTDLTNSRVRNYKRMDKRRVVFSLGVTYQTGLQDVKEIPGVISGIIKSIDLTAFDRAHFSSFGDFSLNFEVVYYVLSSDYNKYMDIQQEINFQIKEEFEKREIEFAYPTQTLFISKE